MGIVTWHTCSVCCHYIILLSIRFLLSLFQYPNVSLTLGQWPMVTLSLFHCFIVLSSHCLVGYWPIILMSCFSVVLLPHWILVSLLYAAIHCNQHNGLVNLTPKMNWPNGHHTFATWGHELHICYEKVRSFVTFFLWTPWTLVSVFVGFFV